MDSSTELTACDTSHSAACGAKIHVAELQAKAREIDRLSAELQQRDQKIQALLMELAHLRRIRFGRKSEAHPGQRDFFEDTLAEDIAACEAKLAADAAASAPPQRV